MAWSKESRQSRGYGASWSVARAQVIARDMGMCQPCKREGRTTAGREVDHITPKAEADRLRWTQAQQDALVNLQCICGPCHKAKTAKDNGRTYRPKVQIGIDGWPVGE
jgi:5-methylcytosine-specific restriction protein A